MNNADPRATQELRAEALLMYQLAQDINAAKTLQDVVEAAAKLMPDCDGVMMNAFENMNFDGATYIEIIATAAVPAHIAPLLRQRIPVLPIIDRLREYPLWWIEDIQGITGHSTVDPVTREIYEDLPTQALIAVPLSSNSTLWGLMMFNYAQPRAFTEDEKRLALGIGELVMSASNRILAQQETALVTEEATFMYTLAANINAANTFQGITDAVAQLMPDCDGVFLNMWEHHDFESSTYSEILAGSNVPKRLEFLLGQKMYVAAWPIENRIFREPMTVIEDVATDPMVDPLSRQNWDEIGTRALLWLMFLKGGRNIGYLFFNYTKPHTFSERDRRIALGISSLAMAALERVRSQMETVAALDETRRLNEQIQRLAALEERTRLARELHDSVSQALYGIGLGAQSAQRALDREDSHALRESLDYVLMLVEAGLTEMRALIFELRPETLETEGLMTALAKQCASIQARHGIRVDADLCAEPQLSIAHKEHLYRIARETLHNVIKHANASHITLRICSAGGVLTLDVIDNGTGFDARQTFPGHLGLASIRERVAALGGSLHIDSAPEHGTHVCVTLPCDN
ncbi:MAG: hypothetical protein IPM16_12955 [Chloroflexi bacterium]|nr:hypothetical protein [Chloroflexota bacterium]